MIEMSILLSVINHIARNVATIFCHEIITKFLAEPRLKNIDYPLTTHNKYLLTEPHSDNINYNFWIKGPLGTVVVFSILIESLRPMCDSQRRTVTN